jgi:hypothetical protein
MREFMCWFSIDKTWPDQRNDIETLKCCAGANRRFNCGGLDFQRGMIFVLINQHQFHWREILEVSC